MYLLKRYLIAIPCIGMYHLFNLYNINTLFYKNNKKLIMNYKKGVGIDYHTKSKETRAVNTNLSKIYKI